MLQTPVALALLPTMIWCLVFAWVRPRGLSLLWLAGGMVVGAFLGGPVWVLESAVDGFSSPGGRLWRDFVQQVIGAACCEESLKFISVVALIGLARHQGKTSARDVVAIAISVGIGFMTLENLFAVIVSDTPMSLAIDRQLTIIAGHGNYQAIMGFFLAMFIRRGGKGWAVAALLVPIFLHGWGDLAEQLFQDEPNPGSFADTMLFNSWIGSIVTTAVAAFSLLWWVRRPAGEPQVEPASS